MALSDEMQKTFDDDVDAYLRELPSLLEQHHDGDFAVISHARVQSVKPSRDSAYAFAYQELGRSFLVKQILRSDCEEVTSRDVCRS